MTNATATIDLLSWLAAEPRSYRDAIDAWHSHCPRLTVWEDAVSDGLIQVERNGGASTVIVTERGRAALARA